MHTPHLAEHAGMSRLQKIKNRKNKAEINLKKSRSAENPPHKMEQLKLDDVSKLEKRGKLCGCLTIILAVGEHLTLFP